ncbi:DUF551 domain-containing protein, partial [Arthrospira platensis SPKY1]|nr:DUF551 domain-containing protein [Arthrospira platensis SPKY1]
MKNQESNENAGDGSVVSDDLFGVWIPCETRLPELTDDGVLVYFAETGSIEMVHRQDYFADIPNGVDKDGEQQYTKWYRSQNVTHWMTLPDPPNVELWHRCRERTLKTHKSMKPENDTNSERDAVDQQRLVLHRVPG